LDQFLYQKLKYKWEYSKGSLSDPEVGTSLLIRKCTLKEKTTIA